MYSARSTIRWVTLYMAPSCQPAANVIVPLGAAAALVGDRIEVDTAEARGGSQPGQDFPLQLRKIGNFGRISRDVGHVPSVEEQLTAQLEQPSGRGQLERDDLLIGILRTCSTQ